MARRRCRVTEPVEPAVKRMKLGRSYQWVAAPMRMAITSRFFCSLLWCSFVISFYSPSLVDPSPFSVAQKSPNFGASFCFALADLHFGLYRPTGDGTGCDGSECCHRQQQRDVGVDNEYWLFSNSGDGGASGSKTSEWMRRATSFLHCRMSFGQIDGQSIVET